MNRDLKNSTKTFLRDVCPPALTIAQHCYRPQRLYFRLMGAILRREEFFEKMTGIKRGDLEGFERDLLRNGNLYSDLNRKFIRFRGRRINFSGWHLLLYSIIRAKNPDVVIESGVFDGHSSTVILQAMEDNGKGSLVSIDLPASNVIKNSTSGIPDGILPDGQNPGWVIPGNLRHRHELILGDARIILPRVLDSLGRICIFLHDSLHTFNHMLFEYGAALPHIKKSGLLLSDDVWANFAFAKFCFSKKLEGYVTGDFGGILIK